MNGHKWKYKEFSRSFWAEKENLGTLNLHLTRSIHGLINVTKIIRL